MPRACWFESSLGHQFRIWNRVKTRFLFYNQVMTIHHMNLQPRYFNYIKNGTKRIELRLYDEKRSKIRLGDTIIFSNPEGESLSTQVIGLLRYADFESLFQDFSIDLLADKAMSKSELIQVLSDFYPAEEQQKQGVLGIRIKPL